MGTYQTYFSLRADLRLQSPSLSTAMGERNVVLYMENPSSLRIATAPNLEKSLSGMHKSAIVCYA